MTDWINESMNDEAVYRTAPATPGLLITGYGELDRNVEYQSNVQGSVAATQVWEMPRRLRDLGIPFSDWHVLLSRYQLGAT